MREGYNGWQQRGRRRRGMDHLHKGVIDRDNEDLAGVLELGRVQVAGNMAGGACGTCLIILVVN